MENHYLTEFGFLPNNWKIGEFSDFADKGIRWSITGGPFGSDLKMEDYTNEGVQIIQLQNIGDGTFNDNYKIFTSKEKADKLISCNIFPEDLILSKMGDPVARVCYVPNTADRFVMASDGIRLVVDEKKFNKKFVHDYINSNNFRKRAITVSTGSTRQRIGLPELKKIKVIIPPLPEQKAIADCLSTWDEAIEKQTKLIAAKEQRKKALMQQLLSGKKRLPGFENTEVCYDKYSNLLSNVKRKEKWDDNKLYQLISVRRRSGGVFAREELFGNQIAVKELMKVKENDFLISKMQIVHGASAIVPKDFENFYVSGSYIVLNVKDENRLRPLFLKWYSTLRSFYHQTFIASYGVHIEKMTFSFQDFLKEKMRLPNVKEQDLIIEILEQSEKEVKLEKTRLLLLLNQKKAIMQQLLIGKVRLVS